MTDNPLTTTSGVPFDVLRRFARRPPARDEERCDLCGEAIGPEHRHLLDLAAKQVYCACRACALLLDTPAAGGGARRLIPTRIVRLRDFEMTDEQWESLQVPVNMVFFCYSAAAERVMAFYPSPMGPTESLLTLTAWDDLTQRNPLLRQMEPDVEALLIHRSQDGQDTYLVPIDECYKLVGLIRLYWKGLSGGGEVREEIERFFHGLNARANAAGGIDA